MGPCTSKEQDVEDSTTTMAVATDCSGDDTIEKESSDESLQVANIDGGGCNNNCKNNSGCRHSHLLTSQLPNDVFCGYSLGYLNRSDILHCMCVGKLNSQFEISTFYCHQHGSRFQCQAERRQKLLKADAANEDNSDDESEKCTDDANDDSSKENTTSLQNIHKVPMLECEDCVEKEFGNERCPLCEKFERCDGINHCDTCESKWCDKCNCDHRGYCQGCAKAFCGSGMDETKAGGCNSLKTCYSCLDSFCSGCDTLVRCAGCDSDHCCMDCFYGDGYYCDICEKDYHHDCKESFFCEGCEMQFCDDCGKLFLCEGCDRVFCHDCDNVPFYCFGCDKPHCKECIPKPSRCMECPDKSCDLHLFTCNVCETSTCTRCTKSYACPDCGKEICAECKDFWKTCSCEKQGKFVFKRNGRVSK